MSANEIKALLHQKIESLSEVQALEVYDFVSGYYSEQPDAFDENAPAVVTKSEQSLANVGSGKTYTTEEILTFVKQGSTR